MRTAHHITNEPTTIVECLKKHFKIDREKAEMLLKFGAIFHNKKRVFEDMSLEKGAYLRIHLQPKRYSSQKVDWRKTIIHENEDYLIVNKPAGIPVHAALDNAEENTLTQLRNLLKIPIHVTQRIDIPVSGLVLFAKTKEMQSRYNKWLLKRKVEKYYSCLTSQKPPQGLLKHYMEDSDRSPKVLHLEEGPNRVHCELIVQSTQDYQHEGKSYFESKIELLTGRTHQIRAQLSFEKAPLLGDTQYGGPTYSASRIALCAYKLRVPIGEKGIEYEINPNYFEVYV